MGRRRQKRREPDHGEGLDNSALPLSALDLGRMDQPAPA